jgi:chromosome segregation ATPase
MHDLSTASVVRSEELIRWDHVLAWCARDQEARYQELWQWRSPRSDSETPALERPKADGLFVMGTILDLFNQNEILLEERLSGLTREIEKTKQEIEKRRREVVYWRKHHDKKLRELLDLDANEAIPVKGGDLYTRNFTDLVNEALSGVDRDLSDLRSKILADQRKIDGLEYRIQDLRDQLGKLKASHAQGAAAKIEIDSGLMERAKARRDLDQLGEQICTYGNVAFRDCSHIAQRRESLSFSEAQDEEYLGEAAAMKQNLQVALQEKADAIQAELRRSMDELDALAKAKRELVKHEDDLRRNRDGLEESLRELGRWDAAATNGDSDDPIVALRDKLEQLEAEEKAAEMELTSLLDGADEARALLSEVFDQSVKTVLSEAYSGAVGFNGRELSFSLRHGPALAGEAMQTLSILIADVSCMLFRVLGHGHLPGLLVHDSPREADLDPRIYESFQLFLASLNDACGGQCSCPFQYIMTTTTPPPEAVQDRFVRDTLDARSENEMLLRKNVARVENGGFFE